MLNPVRVSVGWLTGRLFVFLLILAALVALDAYRDESRLLGAGIAGLVPDRALLQRLNDGRTSLEASARSREQQVNARLQELGTATGARIEERIDELDDLIAGAGQRRRSSTERTVALLTGEGFETDLENEIELQLLVAEREMLDRLRHELATRGAALRDAQGQMLRAARRTTEAWRRYNESDAAVARHRRENPVWTRMPASQEWRRATELADETRRRLADAVERGREFYRARDRWQALQSTSAEAVAQVRSASASILEPLDALIATRQAALDSAERQVVRIRKAVRDVFATALVILVLVTLLPVAIKAAWYHGLAPLVERRPPLRLRPRPPQRTDETVPAGALPPAKVSAVSVDVVLSEGEELLVHPEFLQSSAARGRKDTKWLLNGAYPFTSLAARMVALTRIHDASGERFVVSSRNDPLAEVGVIELAAGEALVLQPRCLVGLVQYRDRPLRLSHRWVFTLGALITLQFRYLIFDGPGRLLVQGCRGVRTEPAGTGRAIDQNATLGFGAHLDYAPRRSETFGAYLLGMHGLFDDGFAGGPGYCLYEEMPYLGRRTGLTGRGLEGLTDGLLKVFGI